MALFGSALVLGSVCCPLPGVCVVFLYMDAGWWGTTREYSQIWTLVVELFKNKAGPNKSTSVRVVGGRDLRASVAVALSFGLFVRSDRSFAGRSTVIGVRPQLALAVSQHCVSSAAARKNGYHHYHVHLCSSSPSPSSYLLLTARQTRADAPTWYMCLHGHGRGGGGGRHLGDVTAYRGDSRCLTPQTHRVETQYLRTARLTVNYLLFIDSSSYGLPLRLVGHDRQHRIRILTSSRLVELTCSYPSRVRSG